jgi:Transposase DDE domain
MVPETTPLLTLLALIETMPLPASPPAHRGRPPVFADRLFLKGVVVMVLKRVTTVHALLAVLDQDTPEMRAVRDLLTIDGRFPSRRTWERRLAAITTMLPNQIADLGDELVRLLDPWHDRGRAVAIASTPLRARGGVWHKKDREAGTVPHTSIDTEAHWTKSGYHGWVSGWKLHLVVTVAAVWIPLRAWLTPANVADNEQALLLLQDLPPEVRFILGDTHYQDPALHTRAAAEDRLLVATKRGPYPHQDDGVDVRRMFHQLRTHAIENVNGQFKAIFDVATAVPTRGQIRTARWLLGGILVSQLTLLHRHHRGLDLRVGLKPFLQAA